MSPSRPVPSHLASATLPGSATQATRLSDSQDTISSIDDALPDTPRDKAASNFDPFSEFNQPAQNTPLSDASTPPDVHTRLPGPANASLEPPTVSYLASDNATIRGSYAPGSQNNSTQLLAEKQAGSDIEQFSHVQKRKSKRPSFLITALVLIVVVLAVLLPVYFVIVKKHNSNTSSGSSKPPGPTTGGDGSVITTETGDTFTYNNPFGGTWVDDPNDPFNNNAQANIWTPPLNTSWTWGKDKVHGVNLGGLFVLEPFITPALYQKYPGSHDEWTLSTMMAADKANGGLGQLEDHYKTFVTEEDIAQIAGAGLNWIRLPIPFWAIETWEGEPFLAKVSWKYILKVLGWARKYGIRVNLDLHTIPGSQNGYNHSGKQGMINFLNGVMGIANAQRTLGYLRIITEFISQPEWQPVIPMFGIINEPLIATIGLAPLSSFYIETHNMIRSITGVGGNNGPYISMHDGFLGLPQWAGYLAGSDRVILDTHPYFAFGGGTAIQPISTGTGPGAGGIWPAQACSAWGNPMNVSQTAFGVTVAGEFSNGFNDCGLFLHGVGGVPTYGGNCDDWTDSSNWNASTKAGIQAFAMASMDALQNWFFWTWKISNSTAGHVEAPLWSYQLGLENGWMPTNPRNSIGTCGSLGIERVQFNGTYLPWQTGGAGAGTIVASATASWGQWPPASINGSTMIPVTSLPTYTSTGPVPTLPPPTLTASATHSIVVGDGWYDTADNGLAATTIQGCSYPDAWNAVSVAPTPCGGGGGNAVVAAAVVTLPPTMR